MARMEIVTCDGCGVEMPPAGVRGHLSHSSMFPADECYSIVGGIDTEVGVINEALAACSLDCLVKLARRLRGDEVDELEALLGAPAAVKPAPKPRQRRKPAGGAS